MINVRVCWHDATMGESFMIQLHAVPRAGDWMMTEKGTFRIQWVIWNAITDVTETLESNIAEAEVTLQKKDAVKNVTSSFYRDVPYNG